MDVQRVASQSHHLLIHAFIQRITQSLLIEQATGLHLPRWVLSYPLLLEYPELNLDLK